LSNANLHAYWCCSIFHVEIFCLNKRSFCLEEHPSSSRALHQLQCTRFWKYITHPLRLISTRNTTHLYEIRCTHCRVLLQFSAKCFVQDKSTCNTGARWAILHRQVNHGDYAQRPASSRHTMLSRAQRPTLVLGSPFRTLRFIDLRTKVTLLAFLIFFP
jgi:hypothetical protein